MKRFFYNLIFYIKQKVFYKIWYPIINKVLHDDSKNIERFLQKKALESTCSYIECNMKQITAFSNKFDLHKYALSFINEKESGLFCEFGVFSGTTINYVANQCVERTVFGFDSFEGIPEAWNFLPKGAFKVDNLPKVRKNVVLVKGWFDESIDPFLKQHSENLLYLHIDSDLYSSAKTIFNSFATRIKKGTIIVFDEYFNYPDWESGEFRAFQEFISSTEHEYKYIGYCKFGEQVAVQII